MSHRFYSAGIERCRRRRTWGDTLISGLMLLTLAALCGWLWSCVKSAAVALPGPGWSRSLAMAPVWQGPFLAGLALTIVVVIALAVRKVRSDDAFYASMRREEDVFAPLREAGRAVPPEDAQRILVVCAAEGREIQRLVKSALRTLSVEDYEDALTVAHDRLTTLVACVEALCERLEAAEVTTKIFPVVAPTPDLAKPLQGGAAQAATDTGAAAGKFFQRGKERS